MQDHLPWIVAGVLVVAVVAAGFWWFARRHSARHGGGVVPTMRARIVGRRGSGHPEAEPSAPAKPLLAVVINPTKFTDQRLVRQRVATVCQDAGWAPPLFLETTVQDPGHGQTRTAVRDGAQVVCSLGGDGTVRVVASALAGTDVPLGILPAGTGNLLARNLEGPKDTIESALTAIIEGTDRRIDLLEMTLDGGVDSYTSLVMCGMGMDAAVMGDTSDQLKRTVGWPAYFVSGVRNLIGEDFRVHVLLDEAAQLDRRVRTVIVGNCGSLLGGMVLFPDAALDDGRLDVAVVSPRGVLGWGPVFARVLTRRRAGHPILEITRAQRVVVRADEPQPVQVDGDVVGEATTIEVKVRPAALTVRVAAD